MTRLPPQREFTDAMIGHVSDALVGTGIRVGDGVAPSEGGWTVEGVGFKKFVGYTVLAVSTLTIGPDGTLADDFGDPRFVASVRGYGGSRGQADYVADVVRNALYTWVLATLPLDSYDWRVVSVTFPRLSGPTRVDTVDPFYWTVADTAQVTLHRLVRP